MTHEKEAAPLRWDYTVQIVFDPVSHTHRAVILSAQDNTKRHLEKTSLDWLMTDVKHAVITKQQKMGKNPLAMNVDEQRIIRPAFLRNGS